MQIYLVGGAVRDQLLKRSIKERDYVVVGATEKQMLAEGCTRVGKDFPVFLHPSTKEEYALARTERKKGFGYAGFECYASPEVTLEQDLLRRDLTINAMAMTDNQEIIDPYNGQNDLNQRVFRHVSAAFAEDPLRVFRIARFMARYHNYGFSIAPETLLLMQSMCTTQEMQAISAERIWQETARALMEPAPFRYFQVLQDAGALDFWFEEWRNVSFHAARLAQFDGEKASEPLKLEQRFAVVCSFASNEGGGINEQLHHLDTMRTRLKLPNSVFSLAKILLVESQRWEFTYQDDAVSEYEQYKSLNAHQLLAGFDHIDLWRNPERLEDLSACLLFMFPTQRHRLAVIQRCANASLKTNVKAIIAAGKIGAEIKTALIEARLDKIQAQLEQPST